MTLDAVTSERCAEPALARLGRFVAEDPLDADGRTLATLRDAVIDCFGCILAGAAHPTAVQARSAVVAMEASGERPLYGTDARASRPAAAFLNAVAGHAVEFDDWELPGNSHPSVVMLPALLASAEGRVTGAEVARAYLAGFEVIARLGEALNFEHYDRGWHSTATLGALGAAAAVARLLRLDRDRTTGALSLAASRAAGLTCQFGSHAKALQAGFAAETGVIAAHLAREGLGGQAHALDHARGLRALTAGTSQARLEGSLAKLGSGPALAEHGIVLKPWPSCGYTHRLMCAAIELAARLDDRSEILRVDAQLPNFHAAILPFERPESRAEALFSIPFVVAMGLRRQRLTLADLDARAWQQRDVAALIERTRVRAFTPNRPQLNYDPQEPDRIDVTLSNGEILSATCALPLGAPRNPMSAEQVAAKLRSNAPRLTDQDLARLFAWQEFDDAARLFASAGVTS